MLHPPHPPGPLLGPRKLACVQHPRACVPPGRGVLHISLAAASGVCLWSACHVNGPFMQKCCAGRCPALEDSCELRAVVLGGFPFGLGPWIVVPVLWSCQSPIQTWLVYYIHLYVSCFAHGWSCRQLMAERDCNTCLVST